MDDWSDESGCGVIIFRHVLPHIVSGVPAYAGAYFVTAVVTFACSADNHGSEYSENRRWN